MFGKNHTKEALSLISKPGKLNPMFGKTYSDKTKILMSNKKGFPVTIYNIYNQYILTFKKNF